MMQVRLLPAVTKNTLQDLQDRRVPPEKLSENTYPDNRRLNFPGWIRHRESPVVNEKIVFPHIRDPCGISFQIGLNMSKP